MTSRIYYTDPYCRHFEAVVIRALEHEHRPAVVLDRTAFYPTSGGQPYDNGTLAERGDPSAPAIQVIETIDTDSGIVHVLTAPLASGAAVTGDVEWTRRFDHMQQHTGQHLLSAAFDRLFDNRTIGFHMGVELSTIDLAKEMSWKQIARAEEEANRIVFEDREVAIRFVSSDEAAALPLRKEPSRAGVLRLIDIKSFDLSACGGTHVARTGAIGAIVVPALERLKGGVRVTFACGGRAMRVFRTLRESVAGSVRALSVHPQELPAAIERMQAESRDLRRSMKKLQQSLAVHEAARLAASTVVEAVEGWDANGLKMIATEITSRTSAVVALFSTSSPVVVVVARSAGRSEDANAVLRALLQRFGGRGGGTADLAHGGGLAGSLEEMLSAARDLLQ